MYIDYNLSSQLRRRYLKEYRLLKRLESWYKIYEPEVEFYLYLDWNLNNPKYQFFTLDIINYDHCVYTKSNKDFVALVNSIKNSTDKVKSIYEEMQRTYKA